ncbi:gamma-glutamyltransferase, partial [Opacimonas viscosa]
PRQLTKAVFAERGLHQIPKFGPLPVSVPGAVDGWFALHEKFGKLPMSALLTPSIKYAREGFPVSEVIAYYWQMNKERIGHYDGFAETFLIDGKV